MAGARRTFVAVTAVAAVLLVGGAVGRPVSAADEAVLIPGATLFKRIDPFYPIIARSYPKIGIHLHDDDDPVVVDYSQNPFATDRALAQGVERAGAAVRAADGPVIVIGESMGSMVAARLAAELAAGTDPPAPSDVRFVLIASPEAGVAKWFREGARIPLVKYTDRRIPVTPYPTAVVTGEYDPWADPPDRPWNLVADANALMGMIYVHGPPSWDVNLSDIPPENTTVDGTVTTYFVPTEHLPLTRPLRDLGVPDRLVDAADEILRPLVDAGYRRHDQPGDRRPYLSDGRIRRAPRIPDVTTAGTRPPSAPPTRSTTDAAAPRRGTADSTRPPSGSRGARKVPTDRSTDRPGRQDRWRLAGSAGLPSPRSATPPGTQGSAAAGVGRVRYSTRPDVPRVRSSTSGHRSVAAAAHR